MREARLPFLGPEHARRVHITVDVRGWPWEARRLSAAGHEHLADPPVCVKPREQFESGGLCCVLHRAQRENKGRRTKAANCHDGLIASGRELPALTAVRAGTGVREAKGLEGLKGWQQLWAAPGGNGPGRALEGRDESLQSKLRRVPQIPGDTWH
eukprot:8426081-Alexandrium_andersonii.AAC.1